MTDDELDQLADKVAARLLVRVREFLGPEVQAAIISPPMPLDPPDVLPLMHSDLGVRAYNCLANAGFETVAQVRDASDWELLRVKNLGPTSLNAIREAFGPSRCPQSRRRVHWGGRFRFQESA